MTNTELNEAIAKSVGFENIRTEYGAVFGHEFLVGYRNGILHTPLPYYCSDLNAMHELEMTLSEKELVWYLQRLSQVRLRQGESGTISCILDRLVLATARQRAEAYARVKGIWKEEPK